MNLNSGFFAAYYYRRKQPNKFYHLPLNTQETHHQQRSHSTLSKYTRSYVINKSFDESFLPSIPTSDDTKDGQRPYRRNDFANNPVFVAKHRLAYLFRNQPSVTSQPNNDLIHLFDPHVPKEKNQLRNKFKQQDIQKDYKLLSKQNRDGHTSVITLAMKPSLPSSQTPDSARAILSHREQSSRLQRRSAAPSVAWINPVITEDLQARSNILIRHDLEPDAIINELLNTKSNILDGKLSPLDSSLLRVKSIICTSGTQQS